MEIYFEGNKKVFANVNGHTVKTDQAIPSGGEGEYPEPFTLFLASLGTCAGIYVKSFCDQRGIPAENIRLTQAQNFNPVKKISKISIVKEKIVLYVGRFAWEKARWPAAA